MSHDYHPEPQPVLSNASERGERYLEKLRDAAFGFAAEASLTPEEAMDALHALGFASMSMEIAPTPEIAAVVDHLLATESDVPVGGGFIWVDGIGPPLEQLEKDYEGALTAGASRDVLALIAEVKRLRGWRDQAAVLEKIIKWEQDKAARLTDERDTARDKCQLARLSASLNAEEARVATARVEVLERVREAFRAIGREMAE